VFENRVLKRIFGPRRDEVTGSWRTLHDEELHNLYFSPSIIRMIKFVCEMGWVCSRNGERRGILKDMMENAGRK
jgi:hypothetical protein